MPQTYYTIKANDKFWKEFVEFRKEWRGKYSISELAKEIGFSPSYVWEVINNEHRGEISTRFVSTAMELMKCTFRELFHIIPVDTDREYTPSRVREQSEHSDPIVRAAREEKISPLVHQPTMWRKRNNKQVRKHLTNVF